MKRRRLTPQSQSRGGDFRKPSFLRKAISCVASAAMVVAFAPTVTMPAVAFAGDEGGNILQTTTSAPCTDVNGNCKYEVMKITDGGTTYTHCATIEGAYDASSDSDLVRSVATKRAVHLKVPGYDNSGITGIGTEDAPWVLHNYVEDSTIAKDDDSVGYWATDSNGTKLWDTSDAALNSAKSNGRSESSNKAGRWANEKSGALVSYHVDNSEHCSLAISGDGTVPNYGGHDTYGDWRQLPWNYSGDNGLWAFYTGRSANDGPQELTISPDVSFVGGLAFAYNQFKSVDVQGTSTTFAGGSLGMYKTPYGFNPNNASTKRQVSCWKSNFPNDKFDAFNGWNSTDGKTLNDYVSLNFHVEEAETFVKSFSKVLSYDANSLSDAQIMDVLAMKMAYEKLASATKTDLNSTYYGKKYTALEQKAQGSFDPTKPTSSPCATANNAFNCLYEVVHSDGTYSHYSSLEAAYEAAKKTNEEVRSVATNTKRSLTEPNTSNQGVTGIGTKEHPWVLHNKNSEAENSWNNNPSGVVAYVEQVPGDSEAYEVIFDGTGEPPHYAGKPFDDAWSNVPWAASSWAFYAPSSTAKITSALVKEDVSSINSLNFSNCESLVELRVESPFTKLQSNSCGLLKSRADKGITAGSKKFKLVCWSSNLPGSGAIDKRIGQLFSIGNGYVLQDDVQTDGTVKYENHIDYTSYSEALEKFVTDNKAAWSLDAVNLSPADIATVLRLRAAEAKLSAEDKSAFETTIYKARFDTLVNTAKCFELTPGIFGCLSNNTLMIDGNGAVPAFGSWNQSAKDTVNTASVANIAIGEGITSIEKGAFAEFTGNVTVNLADNTTIADKSALPAAVTLAAHYGSYAHRFAKVNGLDFKPSGKLRVLFIGNSHTERTFETVDDNSAGYDLVGPVLSDLGVNDDVEYGLIWSGARQLFSSDYNNGTYGNHKAELNSDKYKKVIDQGWDVVVLQDFKESDRMDAGAFKNGLATTVSEVKKMLPGAYVAWYSDFITSDGDYGKAKIALDNVNDAIKTGEPNMPDFAIATSAFVNNVEGILGTRIDDGLHLNGPRSDRTNPSHSGYSQWDYSAGCFLWANILDWFGVGEFSSYVDKLSGNGGDNKRLNAGADLAAAKKAMLAAHESSEPVSGYIVTFDKNGRGTAPAAITNAKYDATITVPDGLTATGYTFDGWFKDKDCKTAWNASADKIQGDTTLFAKWTANRYTVMFNANGGTGTMTNQEFTYDSPQNLSPNVFTRSGYIFAGWKIGNVGSLIADGLKMSNLSDKNGDTVELYAQWTRSSTGGGTYVPTPTPTPDPDQPDTPQAPAKGDVVTAGTGTGQLTFAVTGVADASGKGGTVSLAGCNGSATSVHVPATIEVGGAAYAVTEIAPYAFKGTKQLKKVTMAPAITKIGRNAFEGCKSLKSTTIGTGVKAIGKSAFKGCKALTSVTVTSKKLSKKSVAGCLKGSSVKTVVVKVGSKKANKSYAKKYAKVFTKKVAGKKVAVKASKKALKK